MNALRMSEDERAGAIRLLELALEEDHAHEDVTTRLTVPAEATATVEVRNRVEGCLSGCEVIALAFEVYGSTVTVEELAADGSWCAAGSTVARIHGRWADILAVERSALNLMGMLSGTATATRALVRAAGPSCVVLDTRKTLPGARLIQKYAVRCGGGQNHRMHLADGFLLKDNHRRSGIGWSDLIGRARESLPGAPVVIEVDSLEQFDQVLPHAPDRILLDNFDAAMIREARQRRDAAACDVRLEVSGGITRARIEELAQAGADFVSVGAITHSAPNWDLGFDLVSAEAAS